MVPFDAMARYRFIVLCPFFREKDRLLSITGPLPSVRGPRTRGRHNAGSIGSSRVDLRRVLEPDDLVW